MRVALSPLSLYTYMERVGKTLRYLFIYLFIYLLFIDIFTCINGQIYKKK